MDHLGNPGHAPPSPDDLTTCDREPIHIPGHIQPHGILFALAGPDLRIAAISANVVRYFSREPRTFLNMPIRELLEDASFTAVREAAGSVSDMPHRLANLQMKRVTSGPWRAVAHATPDGLLLEAIRPQPSFPSYSAGDQFERFERATRRLRGAEDTPGICATLASEVRQLTGYDRVKVYRFAADYSGEVIAESNSGVLPSYLGLHFPASDIPVQARALYVMNPKREIPDVNYAPVPLIQADPAPIDLSRAMLRSVSPVHIEYLRNMRVGASMSISILRDGALWGLIACHHHAPHYVAPELRHASVLSGELAAWQLSLVEDADVMRQGAGAKELESLLLHEANEGRSYRDALLRNGSVLLDLVKAAGFAFSSGGSLTTFGAVPDDERLHPLLDFLAAQGPEVFVTDHLAAHYQAAAMLPEVAGLLVVPLGGGPRDLIVWFRPDITRTVKWAGDPSKPVEIRPGLERLAPRSSFEVWTQEVGGHSRPWEPHEVGAANGLRDTIVDLILQRSRELEQMNASLARSNEALEAFAFVASHDLREPLRQIETFGTLLRRAMGDSALSNGNTLRWLEGIEASSKRMRRLINDLTEYARLGRHAQPFAPTDLAQLVANVRTDLEALIDETRATLEVENLPVVMCDQTQIRQVFQNVISNAIKYRHPERAPRISIKSTLRPAAGARGTLAQALEISVADKVSALSNAMASVFLSLSSACTAWTTTRAAASASRSVARSSTAMAA